MKLIIATLDVISFLLKDCSIFIQSGNNVKTTIHKVMRLINEHSREKKLISCAFSIILIFKDKTLAITMKSITSLPADLESLFKQFANDYGPELLDSLTNFAGGGLTKNKVNFYEDVGP